MIRGNGLREIVGGRHLILEGSMRNPDEDYAYELRRQQRIDHENERRDPGRTAELLRDANTTTFEICPAAFPQKQVSLFAK